MNYKIILPMLCCMSAFYGIEAEPLTPERVTAAIQKAEWTLNSGNTRSVTGVDLSRHSYVKLNELTEKIGRESNKNLLAYQDLLRQGYLKQEILTQLSVERPDICTQVPRGCDPAYPYRSINGTCNNLQNPLWGSVLSPFTRVVASVYADNFNEQRGGKNLEQSRLPNVRLISSLIHSDLIHPDSTITNMLPQFGQLLDHDITLTPEGDKLCCTTAAADIDCWSIPVYANDSFFGAPNRQQRCLDFTRSTPYCFPTASGMREQMNIDTAFVDGSFIYGSDNEREFQLRAFSGGRLRTSRANPLMLPLVTEVQEDLGEHIEFMGMFLAGDERVNEMPALATMHTVWFREHNRLADAISARRPDWSDEQIFQEARRIVIAEWQNIVYGEYLPIVLGANSMNYFRLTLPANPSDYTTYRSSVDPTIFHSFATAAYRFGHTLINGIVRLMRELTVVGEYKVRDNFFESFQLTQGNGDGVNLILGGLMVQNAQTYDEHVTEDLTNFLLRKKEDDFGSDLVARNMQRGRDHGLPGYNAYRLYCGLSQLTTWNHRPAEISPALWSKFESVYDRPGDIDLFSAGIAEYPVADGVSGTVFNCLKSVQFGRLKDGDRFFFTHGDQPRPFNAAQLGAIRARRLSDVICDNSNVRSAPGNVFRTTGSSNPTVSCSSSSRPRLDIDLFVN